MGTTRTARPLWLPAAPNATPAPAPPVPEMPKTQAIPEQGRKLRLLDRITGLSKN